MPNPTCASCKWWEAMGKTANPRWPVNRVLKGYPTDAARLTSRMQMWWLLMGEHTPKESTDEQ